MVHGLPKLVREPLLAPKPPQREAVGMELDLGPVRALAVVLLAHAAAGCESTPTPAPETENAHPAAAPSFYATEEDLRSWPEDGGRRVGPESRWPDGGSRVAVLVRLHDGEAPFAPRVLAGVGGADAVAPTPTERWRDGAQRLLTVDLPDRADTVRLSLSETETSAVAHLRWGLFDPVDEPRGIGSSVARELSSTLVAAGVVSRASWGARPTNCSSLDDPKWRMVIHHSAGPPDIGGSVEDEVRALQSWALDGGTFCDLPYHFMVGIDGTLYEGRPLELLGGHTSGANTGNAGMCAMGCYHPGGDCPTGNDAVTESLVDALSTLVAALATDWPIPIDADHVKGHRDYGNATACPGDWLHDRLDDVRTGALDLLSPPTSWGGAVEALVLEGEARDTLAVAPLAEVEGWFDVRNTGTGTWTANTRLATLPRDVASPAAHSTWISPTRVTGPQSETAPGAVGRFPFVLQAPADGAMDLSFALVEEWVTWFPDQLGPAEGAMTAHLVVEEDDEPVDDDSAEPPTPEPTPDPLGAGPLLAGAERVPVFAVEEVGCAGCGGGEAAAWLFLPILLRRARTPSKKERLQ